MPPSAVRDIEVKTFSDDWRRRCGKSRREGGGRRSRREGTGGVLKCNNVWMFNEKCNNEWMFNKMCNNRASVFRDPQNQSQEDAWRWKDCHLWKK